jgi:hypothetical protein
MRHLRLTSALLLILGPLVLAPPTYTQDASCSSPPCAPNTVPCAHVIGAWTDDGGGEYDLSSEANPEAPDEYETTGTATYNPFPGNSGCLFTFDVEGTITHNPNGSPPGTAALDITMTDRGESCEAFGLTRHSKDYQWVNNVQVTNNSCDRATGTWHWVSTPEDPGSLTMTKPADFPSGTPTETTNAVGWSAVQPTMALFKGTIAPSPASFGGRQVFEPPTSADFDDCQFFLSEFDPWTMQGGGWFVDIDGEYGNDRVGYFWDAVDFYRDDGEYPCGAQGTQPMKLYENFISQNNFSTSAVYKQNVLEPLIGLITVAVERDGVNTWRNWGIMTDPLSQPTARVGTVFAWPLQAEMAGTLSSWVHLTGDLPPGLELTGLGVIQGVPSGLGRVEPYIFRVRVTDSLGFYSTRTFAITVLPPLTLPGGQITSQ